MKLVVSFLILSCLAAAGATGRKISDYTETLSPQDSWLYEIAVPGVTNYKVTYGTIVTGVVARVPAGGGTGEVSTAQLNTASNFLYTTETTRNAAVSNAVVSLLVTTSNSAIANLNGKGTNTTFYGSLILGTNGNALTSEPAVKIYNNVGIGRSFVPNGIANNVILYVGNHGVDIASQVYDLQAASGNLYTLAAEGNLKATGGNNGNHTAIWAQVFSTDDGSSRTVTNQIVLHIADSQKTGTLSVKTAYGLYVDRPTGGDTNIGIYNIGPLVQTDPAFFSFGSASAPAISFRADSNTGFYEDAADDLRVSVNGLEMMRWTSNRVGIGAITAQSRVHVYGTDANPPVIFTQPDASGVTTSGLRVVTFDSVPFGGITGHGSSREVRLGGTAAGSWATIYAGGSEVVSVTNGTVTSSGNIIAGGTLTSIGSGFFSEGATIGSGFALAFGANSFIASPSDGVHTLYDSDLNGYNGLQFGGTSAAFPSLGRTNGDLVVFGANRAFAGGSTNRLIVQGGIIASRALEVFGDVFVSTNLFVTNAIVANNLSVVEFYANNLILTNALGSNQVRLGHQDLTNYSYNPFVISGVGGANTNFTLQAGQPEVIINAFTNVSLRGVMGGSATKIDYIRVTMTNGSGTDRTVEFSPATNSFRFSSTVGTNAPSVITNMTQLHATFRVSHTNVLVKADYYPWP